MNAKDKLINLGFKEDVSPAKNIIRFYKTKQHPTEPRHGLKVYLSFCIKTKTYHYNDVVDLELLEVIKEFLLENQINEESEN